MSSDPTAVTKLYEQIPLESMQQVSDSYLAWYVDRVTRQLDEHMAALRSELRENDAKEAGFRPSPNELSAIERLQRSGVTGVDLLDRMVEQGEDWLVVTMRRLDHFEKTGLAPKDYSTWCEHALGGAYDWIDHERLAASGSPRPALHASQRRPPAAVTTAMAAAVLGTRGQPRQCQPLVAGVAPTRALAMAGARATTAKMAATSSASSRTSSPPIQTKNPSRVVASPLT